MFYLNKFGHFLQMLEVGDIIYFEDPRKNRIYVRCDSFTQFSYVINKGEWREMDVRTLSQNLEKYEKRRGTLQPKS